MDMKVTHTGQELLIPLTALRPSKRNARKSGGSSIRQLARSIERLGLLQNLVVTDSGDGKHYEVEAGKRRLKALLYLQIKCKRLPKNHAVRCLLVPDGSARTVSLAENVQREAMSPADELDAFKALIDEGRSVEEVAADFGVTPLVVQRRLKLANVSRRLIADYRKGNVSLDQLMALAVTDDPRAQEAAFYNVPEWQREPGALRDHLTAEDVDACRDAVARFVGFEAYQAAGGGYRRDLFADEGQGLYLTDRALLDRLAGERLAEVATTVQAEGWAWVETAPRSTASELYAFQRVRPKRRQPTRREAQAIVRLRRRIRVIDAALQAEDGVSDEAEAQALHDEGRKLSAELEAQEQALAEYSRKARGMAGVVVTVDGNGAALVHRGLVREADAEEAQADDGDRGGKAKKQKPAKANSGISAKLARTLSAHRTVAMQAELARQPGVALVAVVYPLALRSFYHERHAGVVQISGTPADRLERYAADLPESPAVAALIEARQAWRAKLPTEPEGLFAVLRELSQDELLSLLAVCVAGCIDAVTADTADQRTNALAGALDLDMAQWWTPTAAGFFNHVPKARIVEAIKSFAPKQAHQLAVVKKGELAATAERLAAGTGWLPDMLRKAA